MQALSRRYAREGSRRSILAILPYVGSPQSKEGDNRMEATLDEILRRLDPQDAEHIITKLDEDYARHAHR